MIIIQTIFPCTNDNVNIFALSLSDHFVFTKQINTTSINNMQVNINF